MQNNDLISRKALIEALENADADICEEYPDCYCEWGFSKKAIEELLQNIPAVEAVVLPCKPGTTVYEVSNNTDACYDCRYYGGGFGESYCEKPGCNYISYPTVQDTPVCEKHFFEVISYPATEQQLFDNRVKFGKTVFLTREEAEAALARMKG